MRDSLFARVFTGNFLMIQPVVLLPVFPHSSPLKADFKKTAWKSLGNTCYRLQNQVINQVQINLLGLWKSIWAYQGLSDFQQCLNIYHENTTTGSCFITMGKIVWIFCRIIFNMWSRLVSACFFVFGSWWQPDHLHSFYPIPSLHSIHLHVLLSCSQELRRVGSSCFHPALHIWNNFNLRLNSVFPNLFFFSGDVTNRDPSQ